MMSVADRTYNKGLSYAKQGRLFEAQQVLSNLVKSEPGHVDAVNVLGKVYLHLGNLSMAEECWQQSLLRAPDDPVASECVRTLQRNQFLWKFFSVLRMVGVLMILLIGGYSMWQLELPQRVGQAAGVISEVPGKLRAQSAKKETSAAAPSTTLTTTQVQHTSSAETSTVHQDSPTVVTAKTSINKSTPSNNSSVPKSNSGVISAIQKSEATTEHKKPEPATGSAIKDAGDIPSIYDTSLKLLWAGRATEAMPGFQSILDSGLESSLLDNAQFWLAECYVAEKRYEDAIEAFSRVRSLPDGNKAHDAELRLRKVQRLISSN